MALAELQEQRMGLANEIKTLADTDPENWTDELEARWSEVNKDYDALVESIDKELRSQEAAAARIARVEALAERAREYNPEARVTSLAGRMEVAHQLSQNQDENRALALHGWLCHGSNKRKVDERMQKAASNVGLDVSQSGFDCLMQPSDNVRGFRAWNAGHSSVATEFDKWQDNRYGNEHRQQLVSPAADGGYTVPVGFQRELERALLDFGGMRRVARIWSTAGSNPINWPTVNDTGNVAQIVGENTTNHPAVDAPFDQVVFNAFKYTSLIQASAELLEDSAFNLAAVFGSMLGERLGRGTAADYAQGVGTTTPTGVCTESAEGKVAASATAITFDEVIDLIHSIDPAYRRFSSFGMAFHDTTLAALRKLKDSQGRYLWEPSLQVGEPDRIFGVPYVIDQDFPTIADGVNSRIIVCGAFEKFVIRDHASVRFYRLEERYRELDLTGFSIFFRTDSRIVDAGTGPIKHLALAAV